MIFFKNCKSPRSRIVFLVEIQTFGILISCFFSLQEAARGSKAAPLSPDDAEEAESPMPSQVAQPAKRRGAISAEPITEEDASSYVKKASLRKI